MNRNYHHRVHTIAQPETRNILLLIIASLVGLFILAGCGSGEAPPADVVSQLAKKCAQGPHLSLSREYLGRVMPIIPLGWEEVKNKEATILGAPEVGEPIRGYFNKKKDETYSIWPIEMHVQITLRKKELPMSPGTFSIFQRPPVPEGKPSGTPTVQEMVKEINILCYVFKDKNGQWQVSSKLPTDVTPFYQRWWQALKRKWRA
jgi:hypothetical protein